MIPDPKISPAGVWATSVKTRDPKQNMEIVEIRMSKLNYNAGESLEG